MRDDWNDPDIPLHTWVDARTKQVVCLPHLDPVVVEREARAAAMTARREHEAQRVAPVPLPVLPWRKVR